MLIDKLNWRYATKKMDPAKSVPLEKVTRILEAANLAPTSSGLQPFEIYVVTNTDIKEKLSEAAFGQAQVKDASHVLVFAAWDNYTAARIDAVVQQTHLQRGTPMEALNGYFDNLKANYLPRDPEVNYAHAARQAYLAMGVALVAAAFEEVDATPMEGFSPDSVDAILGLRDKGLRAVTLMPLGYRAAEGDWLNGLPKVRKALTDLITEVK